MRQILIYFVLVCSFTVQSQINVSGTVTNEKGEAMPFVTVSVKSKNKGTKTDFDGKYMIKKLPKGKYDLEIKYLEIVY